VEEVLGTLESRQAVDVEKDLPPAVAVTANRDALYTVVKSALDNALVHADSEVCVTVHSSPQGYDIVVEDDGPGISEEQLAPIKAGTETSLNHGQGLGLWQLRWGVDVLNGELSFETDDGTIVHIRIPDQAEREG
jgi:signal transduction histidine kinase